MLRQRKLNTNDHLKQTFRSEKEQLITDQENQNFKEQTVHTNTKEMQMLQKWLPLQKELIEAELFLACRCPGPGFTQYKPHLWPDNVRLYRKVENNRVIFKVYFGGKEEYFFWKTWRKEQSVFASIWENALFAFTKLDK